MDNFFTWATAPYMTILGDFALPIVWGFVISLIYIKTEHSGLTTLSGLLLLGALMETNSWIDSSVNQLYFWAVSLAATSFGCTMFYLIKVRAQSPAS
jgi:hypothetical protein